MNVTVNKTPSYLKSRFVSTIDTWDDSINRVVEWVAFLLDDFTGDMHLFISPHSGTATSPKDYMLDVWGQINIIPDGCACDIPDWTFTYDPIQIESIIVRDGLDEYWWLRYIPQELGVYGSRDRDTVLKYTAFHESAHVLTDFVDPDDSHGELFEQFLWHLIDLYWEVQL